MSAECDCAARLSAGPTKSGRTPFFARYELMRRTTASSPSPSVALDESVLDGVSELATAGAPTASDTPSTTTTPLRMRLFPSIKRLREINGRRRCRPALQLQF